MWFQYRHDCLKVLSDLDTQVHKDLYNLTMELDKTLKDEWLSEVYTLEFYDENEWTTYVEVFTDEQKAKERFYEVMKIAFECELKKLWDVDWKNVYDFESDQFYFRKDAYRSHYDIRSAKWIYTDDWRYPRYTWKCWCMDYYSELTLKKTKVNKPFIFVKEEETWANKN